MNQKAYHRVFLLIIFHVLFLSASKAQSVRDQFDAAKQGHKASYDEFVEQKDKEFAAFLRKNWRSFRVHDGHIIEPKPKPVEFPAIRKLIPEPLELFKKDSLPSLDLKEGFVMPVDHKLARYDVPLSEVSFAFFGDTVSLTYDNNLNLDVLSTISPQAIGDYWEKVSLSNYRIVLDGLLSYQRKYVLNDFGYYLLVREFSQAVFRSDNQRRLFTWFILSKSKYKTKIGYNLNEVFLLLPSTRKVYGKRYFTQNDTEYYLMEYKGGEIYAYDGDYPGAFRKMDFTIKDGLNLRHRPAVNNFTFFHEDGKYAFDFEYNQNAIDYYNEVPPIELAGYFDGQMSSKTARLLLDKLSPIVNKMNEVEAVSFLLALVQKGFNYQIDKDQFGAEKVFFPEEILHYPFSDCEDRAVFFAYLVSHLTGNEVVGLDYPSHVATAVHFQQNVSGDYVLLNEKKYVVCDPTYVGAPIGVSMKDLTSYTAEIIKNESAPATLMVLERLKDLLGIRGELSEPRLLKVREGILMAGNYSKQVWVGNESISPIGSGLLLASFDHSNNYNWSRIISTEMEDEIKEVVLDEQRNILVLTRLKGKRYEIAKLDANGEILWSKTLPSPQPVSAQATVQATLFDENGNRLAGKSYLETDYFESKSLTLVKNNILVILPIDHE